MRTVTLSSYLALFVLFGLLILIFYMFCLCDPIDDVPFKEAQEQQFEEEIQQFDEEGKWTLSVFNRLPTVGYTQGGKFWVRRRRDQELEGARNTKLRQVRAARCVTPYVLYGGLYCFLCRKT
jgi:hypothetical protein